MYYLFKKKFYWYDIGIILFGIMYILYFNIMIIVNIKFLCIEIYLNVFVLYKVLLNIMIRGLMRFK